VVKTLSPESLLLYASEETAAYMVGRLPQSLRTVVCAPFMLLRGRLQKAKARQSRS